MIEGRHYAARQSQGARHYQEDEFGFLPLSTGADGTPRGLVAVLADGMGGHKGGAHASAAAVAAFIKAYQDSDLPTTARLRHALERANERIAADSRGNPDLEGMGCTLLGAAVADGSVQWISVGDSPFWVFRGDRLTRLNEDHSMAPVLAEQVAAGQLSTEDAARHPQRNALRSAVVGESLPLVDLRDAPMPLEQGDLLVLASDGLETLSEEEIAEVLRAGAGEELDELAARLIAAVEARQRRGQDNITVVLVDPFRAASTAAAAEIPTIVPERARKETPARRSAGVTAGIVAIIVAAGAAVAWTLGLPPFGRADPVARDGGAAVAPGAESPEQGAGRRDGEPPQEAR